MTGTDAVVFAAGGGPGSGAARKPTMHWDGAVKLSRRHERGYPSRPDDQRYRGREPPDGDGVFDVDPQAKAAADAAVMASDRDWTIVRPGASD